MRIIIISIAILLFGYTLDAQPNLEVRAGYTLYEQLPLNHSYSVGGFFGGAVLDFKTNKKLSLQTGLLFVMKGTEPILHVNNFEIKERLYYLEAPLMLSWKTPVETSGLYFDWGVGLYLAHGLDGTINEKESDATGWFISKYPAFDSRKRSDTGLQAGIGIGGKRFHLGIEGQVSVISPELAGIRFFYGHKLEFGKKNKRFVE